MLLRVATVLAITTDMGIACPTDGKSILLSKKRNAGLSSAVKSNRLFCEQGVGLHLFKVLQLLLHKGLKVVGSLHA